MMVKICWQGGESRRGEIVDWNAVQTTVACQLGGVRCLLHFCTETGVQLLEGGQPDPAAQVWIELEGEDGPESNLVSWKGLVG